MREQNTYFLVQLAHALTTKQWFFVAWAAIVLLFTALIMSYYRTMTRRNFKEGQIPKSKGLVPASAKEIKKVSGDDHS